MKVGTRVIVSQVNDTWSLGIVTSVTGDVATVLYDKGETHQINLRRLTPCTYFAQWIKKDVDKEWMEKYSKRVKPKDYDILKFFQLRKTQLCTIPLLTAMWYWGNHYLFSDKLKLCKLKTSAPRGLSGVYQYKKGNPSNDWIGVSSRSCVTPIEIFSTLLHEMVHQFNFRIDWLTNRSFDPASGTHGKTFKKWAPILKEVAGVILTTFHDAQDIAIEGVKPEEGEVKSDEETDTNTKKKAITYVFLASWPTLTGTKYVACKSEDKDLLIEVKQMVRGRAGMTGTYEVKPFANAPLLGMITSAKKNTGVGVMKMGSFYLSILSEKVFDNIKAAAG